MNGLVFFFFLIFFVFPILKKISKNAGKRTSKYQNIAARLQEEARKITEQADHGVTRTNKHKQLHRNDSADVFPEEHQAHVRERDKRDRQEYRKMETTIHGKRNKAMTKVGNKSRSDWGARGDTGISSSKGIVVFILLLLLAHFTLAAFFPNLLPGN